MGPDFDDEPAIENFDHDAPADRGVQTVVYRVPDNRTSLVVRQFNDDAVMRRRACYRALDQAKANTRRGVFTDRRA